jgi:hypothetical protein
MPHDACLSRLDATCFVFMVISGSLKQITELNLANEQLSQYGPSFTGLSVEVTPETTSRLHVKIQPSSAKRWEVPDNIVPRFVHLLCSISQTSAGHM